MVVKSSTEKISSPAAGDQNDGESKKKTVEMIYEACHEWCGRPWKPGLVAAALKALFELAVLIGGAALPGQTLAGPCPPLESRQCSLCRSEVVHARRAWLDSCITVSDS